MSESTPPFGDVQDFDLGAGGGEGLEPGGGDNRTFIIAVAAMIGFMLLVLAFFAVYALVIRPRQVAQREAANATANAQNTQIAAGLTQTAAAAQWTPTFTPSPIPTATPVPTATPSPTPVIVSQPPVSPSPVSTIDLAALGATATAVYLTQVAAAALTPTSTALPSTGFADEVGLPGLLGVALGLLVLIFLVRRVRAALQP